MRNCICMGCRRELDSVLRAPNIQPLDGVAFWTVGHYGSRVFDPMDGSWLQIAVCDDCLVEYFETADPSRVDGEGGLIGHPDTP